jgi:hypothetical protein
VTDSGPMVVASLENAKAAMQNALDHMPRNAFMWGDMAETYTDAAYGEVEQMRRLLDAINERLMA